MAFYKNQIGFHHKVDNFSKGLHMKPFKLPALSTGLVFCFSTLLLSACGGSSGSDKDDTIAITADNALNILLNGKTTFDYALDAVDNTTDLFDTVAAKPSAPESKTSPFAVFSSAIINNAKLSNSAALQAPLNTTVSCESGTLSYSGDYSQTATSESVDATLTFNDCVYMGVEFDGSVTVQSTRDQSTETGSGIDSNGNLSITFDGETHVIKNYSGSWSYNNITGHKTASESFSFNSPSINGSVTYKDTATWNRFNYAPGAHEGSALITGAKNSKLRVSAIDDTQFRLEVDADGDGNYEYSQPHNWSVINLRGGSSAVDYITPVLPIDAVIFNADNADLIASAVLENIDIINEPLRLFTDITCDSGSIIIDSTGSPSSRTTFILLHMSACDVISNIFYTGTVFFTGTYIPDTIYITSTSHADLDISTVAEDYQLKFLLYTNQTASTGYNADYTFSLSNTLFGGVLATTSVPLLYDFTSNLQSGELIVYGANQSRLRLVITGPGTVDIYLDTGDGIFTFHSSTTI